MGFDIVSNTKNKLSNRDLIEHDIRVIVKGPRPVIFDVGANKGQSISFYRSLFSDATIYSFEPNTELYELLATTYKGHTDTVVSNIALGESKGSNEFIIFENNELSSFKPMDPNSLNPFSNTKVGHKTNIAVNTLDSYLQENNITEISLLKIDTQGYELEILKGSIESLQKGAIKHIYLELSLVPLYKGQSDYLEVIGLLYKYNYQLVGLYEMHRTNNYIEWTNALFTLVSR